MAMPTKTWRTGSGGVPLEHRTDLRAPQLVPAKFLLERAAAATKLDCGKVVKNMLMSTADE